MHVLENVFEPLLILSFIALGSAAAGWRAGRRKPGMALPWDYVDVPGVGRRSVAEAFTSLRDVSFEDAAITLDRLSETTEADPTYAADRVRHAKASAYRSAAREVRMLKTRPGRS